MKDPPAVVTTSRWCTLLSGLLERIQQYPIRGSIKCKIQLPLDATRKKTHMVNLFDYHSQKNKYNSTVEPVLYDTCNLHHSRY